MKITVEVPDEKLLKLCEARFEELFGDDARYRNTSARELVRKSVDDAAVEAVRQALDAIAAKLPDMAASAVQRAVEADIESAAKRGMGVLRKLYAGFNPNKLTEAQRAWLEKQIVAAATAKEETQPD